uniref:Uncharacterized protein n=1 Tax=Oryza brachyantha TaxID=4533 RepID=J3LER2_ORYBR
MEWTGALLLLLLLLPHSSRAITRTRSPPTLVAGGEARARGEESGRVASLPSAWAQADRYRVSDDRKLVENRVKIKRNVRMPVPASLGLPMLPAAGQGRLAGSLPRQQRIGRQGVAFPAPPRHVHGRHARRPGGSAAFDITTISNRSTDHFGGSGNSSGEKKESDKLNAICFVWVVLSLKSRRSKHGTWHRTFIERNMRWSNSFRFLALEKSPPNPYLSMVLQHRFDCSSANVLYVPNTNYSQSTTTQRLKMGWCGVYFT